MNKRQERTAAHAPRNARQSVYKIIIVILAVILALNFLILMLRTKEDNTVYTYEYSELLRSLRDNDIPELEDMLLYNKANGGTTQEDTQEFEYIGKYYDAAMLFKAYTESGETDKAAEQKALMEEYAGKLSGDDFLAAKAHIDEVLRGEIKA